MSEGGESGYLWRRMRIGYAKATVVLHEIS